MAIVWYIFSAMLICLCLFQLFPSIPSFCVLSPPHLIILISFTSISGFCCQIDLLLSLFFPLCHSLLFGDILFECPSQQIRCARTILLILGSLYNSHSSLFFYLFHCSWSFIPLYIRLNIFFVTLLALHASYSEGIYVSHACLWQYYCIYYLLLHSFFSLSWDSLWSECMPHFNSSSAPQFAIVPRHLKFSTSSKLYHFPSPSISKWSFVSALLLPISIYFNSLVISNSTYFCSFSVACSRFFFDLDNTIKSSVHDDSICGVVYWKLFFSCLDHSHVAEKGKWRNPCVTLMFLDLYLYLNLKFCFIGCQFISFLGIFRPAIALLFCCALCINS